MDVTSSFDDLHALIERYLAGECTPAEADRVTQMIAGDSKVGDDVAALRGAAAVGRAGVDPAEIARVGIVGAGKSALRLEEGRSSERGMRTLRGGGMGRLGNQTLRRWILPLRSLKGIGAVTVFAVIAMLFRLHSFDNPGTTHVYTTRAHQQAKFQLNDGTQVMLSPGSTLALVNFGSRNRSVVLEGEAFFDVARSQGAPFVVQSGAVTTRVLGTSFLIRRYAGNDGVHIAVSEGKVGLTTHAVQQASVTLVAGQVATITDSTRQINTIDDVTSGTINHNGLFVFHDAPVPKVLETLTRWYGYHFRCTDSALTQQTVTIGLSMQSSSAALSALEDLLNVHLTVVGDTVTLTSQRAVRTKGTARMRVYDVWTPTREIGR